MAFYKRPLERPFALGLIEVDAPACRKRPVAISIEVPASNVTGPFSVTQQSFVGQGTVGSTSTESRANRFTSDRRVGGRHRHSPCIAAPQSSWAEFPSR